MRVQKIAMFLSVFLSLQSACAEVPGAVVSPSLDPIPMEEGAGQEGSQLQIQSLVFQGSDLDGRTCTLYIGGLENPNPQAGQAPLQIYARMAYQVHGVTPIDLGVDFYRYQRTSQSFLPVDSNEPGTLPVLAGAALDDSSQLVDMNQLLAYENAGVLKQSLRVEFRDADLPLLMESLANVVSDNSQLAANLPGLDQMSRAVVRVRHSGHYDPGVCEEFVLAPAMETITYAIDTDGHDDHEDGDDHDHDHGDDHDHDHEGDHHEGEHDDHDHGDDHSHDHN